MEQGPDELTERRNEDAEELDRMTGTPLNAPDKETKADAEKVGGTDEVDRGG